MRWKMQQLVMLFMSCVMASSLSRRTPRYMHDDVSADRIRPSCRHLAEAGATAEQHQQLSLRCMKPQSVRGTPVPNINNAAADRLTSSVNVGNLGRRVDLFIISEYRLLPRKTSTTFAAYAINSSGSLGLAACM